MREKELLKSQTLFDLTLLYKYTISKTLSLLPVENTTRFEKNAKKASDSVRGFFCVGAGCSFLLLNLCVPFFFFFFFLAPYICGFLLETQLLFMNFK